MSTAYSARPFLNYMYAMVPYVIKEKELVKVLSTMKEWFSEKR
jgi:adenosylmethionine-8-amino-7-oxononanoate aminotransferase